MFVFAAWRLDEHAKLIVASKILKICWMQWKRWKLKKKRSCQLPKHMEYPIIAWVDTYVKKRKKTMLPSVDTSDSSDPECGACHVKFTQKPTLRNSYMCMGHNCTKLVHQTCVQLKYSVYTCSDCDSDDDLPWNSIYLHAACSLYHQNSFKFFSVFCLKRLHLIKINKFW